MKALQIKSLTLSDLHLGHRRNKTSNIIKNLDAFFDNYSSRSQFVDLDILYFAGDIFDTLLDFASDDIHEATLWLSRIMRFCAVNDIILRILEGTPSHDWKQSRILNTAVKLTGLDINYKYIDTLYIEHIEKLGIHILYVPDEWTANTDLTFSQVKALMAELHIDQVDMAIMHGVFNYQLHNVPGNIQKHSEADYLGIVKHFITIGHHHNFSTYERIIAQGSFDRLAHNEEEPKGAVLCVLNKDSEDYFSFIENKNAKIFKTILLKSKDLDRSLAQIAKQTKGLPFDSQIRIKAIKDHPLYIAFDDLKVKFPEFVFSKISLEDEEEEDHSLADAKIQLDQSYTPIHITRDNIVELLMAEITVKHSLTPQRLSLLRTSLDGLNT